MTRRDRRRFGPGPYLLGLRRNDHHWGSGLPFDVPAVAAVEDLRLDAHVTLLAGDNGTGKSTLVEAIATAIGLADEGGELERSGELPAVPRAALDGAVEPVLSATKPRNGYFLRAESFFNIASFVDSGDIFAPDLSLYGDVPLHGQSHGESFLALAANRLGSDGFYVLDEPEADGYPAVRFDSRSSRRGHRLRPLTRSGEARWLAKRDRRSSRRPPT